MNDELHPVQTAVPVETARGLRYIAARTHTSIRSLVRDLVVDYVGGWVDPATDEGVPQHVLTTEA